MIHFNEQDTRQWLQATTGIAVSQDSQALLNELEQAFYGRFVQARKRLAELARANSAETAPRYLPPLLDTAREQWFTTEVLPAVVSRGDIVIRKATWPAGYTWALAVTHDVDLVRAHSLGKVIRQSPTRLVSYLRSGTHPADPYWNFEDLLATYERQHLKATFFFLVKAREKHRFRYRLASPLFQSLLRRLHQAGQEIGLHSSLNAFRSSGQLLQEKRQLESILGEAVAGMRQHYLNLTFPQAWDEIAGAHFQYDSSAGLNHGLGFAYGTSLPFFPIAERSAFVEIPFGVMDYPMLAMDAPPQFTHTSRLIGEVQQLQGLLVLIIHPHHFAEPHFFPYKEFLMLILSENNVWRATLKEIATWWQQRYHVQLQLKRHDLHTYTLRLNAPNPISDLVLELFLPEGFQLMAGQLPVTHTGGNRWQLKIPPTTGALQIQLEVVRQ